MYINRNPHSLNLFPVTHVQLNGLWCYTSKFKSRVSKIGKNSVKIEKNSATGSYVKLSPKNQLRNFWNYARLIIQETFWTRGLLEFLIKKACNSWNGTPCPKWGSKCDHLKPQFSKKFRKNFQNHSKPHFQPPYP